MGKGARGGSQGPLQQAPGSCSEQGGSQSPLQRAPGSCSEHGLTPWTGSPQWKPTALPPALLSSQEAQATSLLCSPAAWGQPCALQNKDPGTVVLMMMMTMMTTMTTLPPAITLSQTL